MKRFLLLAFCCLFAPVFSLYAQFETASVLGYVRDSSGAVVPHATVTLTNQGTRTEVKLHAGDGGAFEFTDVKLGQYRVTAEAPGFEITTTEPFGVQVNARQRVDVALRVGASETVTVTGAASLLDTDDSERGQVIGTREVENLPLNGRAYADLAALVPGVRRDALENGTDSSRDASFNVNGQRSEFNNFLLDGLDNNAYGTSNQGFSNQAIPASPDAISEFRVETDNYSAEYGRSAGAVINVSIRSGTNQFHGKAYDYIRNTVFNAIGPFTPPNNPLTGTPQKPTLIRNQFGGTFGGPLWKDHTFFFADYEGDRQVVHAIMQATVPTANQAGTSALAIANGGYTFLGAARSTAGAALPYEGTTPIQIRNPITGQIYTNGVVPFNDPTVSSFAKGVLANLPTPNVAGVFANNYASLPADTINDDKGDVRVDQTFSQKTTAFVRYSQHKGNILSPPAIQGPAGGNSNGNVQIFNQQIAGGVTRTLTQNAILDARFAFTRTDGGKFPYGQHMTSLMAGIPGLPTDPTVARSLNAQTVTGYTQFGNQTSNPQFQDPYVYNPKVNFTLLHGRNSYKLGYEYQAIFTTDEDFNPTYGQSTYAGGFSFNGASSTALTGSTDTGLKEAAYLGDFLFGAQSQYQLNNYQVVHLNQRMHFLYLQDDFRATPKLTINAGLRYELVTPQWESNNLLSNFSPATNTLIPASPGSIYNRALVNMPKLDFAPRLGFAYSVDRKTVVRGGYGINYAQFNREGGENLLVYNLPYIVNTSINQVPINGNPAIAGSSALSTCTTAQAQAAYAPGPATCFRTTIQGFPTGFTSPSVVTSASYANTQARYIPANLPTGYVQAFHLTVQRQITGASTFEVSYVGEHGVKLQVLADYNQASANPVTATCNNTVTTGCINLLLNNQGRPLKTFPTIEETLPAGFLSYNALQTKFEHRTSHGLYLLNSFTWSRAIDNASGHLDTNAGDNSRINLANPMGDRGVSGYNQPLNETLSLVYDLPFGKGRMFGSQAPRVLQELLGGWQVTAIENAQSGAPVNIIYTPTAFQSVSTILNQRPNQLSKNAVIPKSQRVRTSGNQGISTLNLSAFSLPTPNQPYGNAGRNSVRFDPYYDTDLGLHKSFALYPEGVVFDFRAEAFNLLNQINYAFPGSETFSPGTTSFGVVTSATTQPARVLQFAGKIIF
ncbi:MAG: carboxypeptidase regulatory-like domain-containing protein [Janthinobacterium lividum]